MESIQTLIQENLAVVVIVLAALGLVALVVALLGASVARVVTRRFAWVTGGAAAGPDTLSALVQAVEANQNGLNALRATVEDLALQGKSHFRRMGLVRYDAFEGIAGHQSFSLCLLDDNRNGVLMSSLVGSGFSRSYAVEINDGQAARKLGDEESRALAAALENSATR